MSLTSSQIKIAFNKFITLRNADHRYASFDYCYNYFNKFKDKRELASQNNLEMSCLHLGFYLANWGMFRNSELTQKSLKYYVPIIKWLSHECPDEIWRIDVNNYNEEKIELLKSVYKRLNTLFAEINKYRLTLITKTMLGVWGNTPAFDKYFIKTFKGNFKSKPAFTSFNSTALIALKNFYTENKTLIEELRRGYGKFNFRIKKETKILYTRAKIIDMIGFGHSYNPKKK